MKIDKYTFMPIIQFELVIPFVHIYTTLIRNSYERLETEYVVIYFNIYKWSFHFRLYDHYRKLT